MNDLRDRTKLFSLQIVRLVESLPKNQIADVISRQLLRAGTSVGANYRAVCRAKSKKDFIAKLAIVEEECDETIFWMELLIESGMVPQSQLGELAGEATELLRIFVASAKTAKSRI